MSTLTISRAALTPTTADLVLPRANTAGTGNELYLEPGFSPGQRIWRKITEDAPNVHGRTWTALVLAEMTVTGSIVCDATGHDSAYLQSLIAEVILALTQYESDAFQTSSGLFTPFNMTLTHGSTPYTWTCTEPADIGLGQDGVLLDDQMEELVQSVSFTITRNPIPVSGPF